MNNFNEIFLPGFALLSTLAKMCQLNQFTLLTALLSHVTKALICHVVHPTDRVCDGRALVANTPWLASLGRNTFCALNALETRAGVQSVTLSRVDNFEVYTQAAGILKYQNFIKRVHEILGLT